MGDVKQSHLHIALLLLAQYEEEGSPVLQFLTADETWVQFYIRNPISFQNQRNNFFRNAKL